MLGKFSSIFAGLSKKNKHRNGSPTRLGGSLLHTNSAPAGLPGTDGGGGASQPPQAATSTDQQQHGAAATNGCCTTSAPADAAAVGVLAADHRLEQVAAVHRRSSSDGMLPSPSATDLVLPSSQQQQLLQQQCPAPLPAGVLRSSSGSSGSRRASILSDSGRASRRTSLQQSSDGPLLQPDGTLPEQQCQLHQQQQQQQASGTQPCVAQLPLHLLQRHADSPPPSVAQQQHQAAGGTTTSTPHQAPLNLLGLQGPGQPPQPPQPPPQPFWQASAWSFGVHSEKNQRAAMEDRSQAVNLTGSAAFPAAHRAGFFAVFDGHAGAEAAQYLADNMLGYVLERSAADLAADPLRALGDAVERSERELVRTSRCCAGSTLCALLMVDDKLHVAHVGDSRAVLGRGGEARQLTRDHKPGCELEAARIASDDPEAEISSDGYIYGELAVARAIGSAHFKRDPSKRALIARPDLTTIQLGAEDDFVLLASDGLWDVLPNAEAVAATRRSLASNRGDAAAAARALVDRAQRRASSDNISVVTLLLHGRAIAMPRSNSMLFKRAQLSSMGAAAGAGGGAANGGNDSPRSYSSTAPCSGASTPMSSMTPRSSTPVLGTPARDAGVGGAGGGGASPASCSPVPVGRC